MFGTGISHTGEIIDLGVATNIIKKSGSWFSYDGNKLAQGRDATKALLEDNPELCEEIDKKIMAIISGKDIDITAMTEAEKDETLAEDGE